MQNPWEFPVFKVCRRPAVYLLIRNQRSSPFSSKSSPADHQDWSLHIGEDIWTPEDRAEMAANVDLGQTIRMENAISPITKHTNKTLHLGRRAARVRKLGKDSKVKQTRSTWTPRCRKTGKKTLWQSRTTQATNSLTASRHNQKHKPYVSKSSGHRRDLAIAHGEAEKKELHGPTGSKLSYTKENSMVTG